MKTQNENVKISIESLQEENSLLKKKMRRERFITHSLYLVITIVLVLLLCKTCKENSQSKTDLKVNVIFYKKIIEDLNKEIAILRDKKAILEVERATENGKTGTKVSAKIVKLSECGYSVKFIPDVIKRVRVEVPVPVKCPEVTPCPELPVVKDTLPLVKAISSIPDTLKLSVERVTPKSTSLLYSQVSVLPTQFNGVRNRSQFNYDVVPDLHMKEYWKKARTHLWIGTGLASAGVLGFTATMFYNVPTFGEYNGLGYFDHANKYYDRNVHQRERLNALKWARGVSIGVGVLGGAEIIHGILLLKNADVSVSPQTITLKYSF